MQKVSRCKLLPASQLPVTLRLPLRGSWRGETVTEGVLQQLFFIYTIYPRLLAQKTQKVRVRALKKVVVTQTLPVRVPSWPICLAIT